MGKDILVKEINSEKNKFIKAIKKIEKLAPKANTKRKKEIVNNYTDQAQKHYDNMYSLLNESVNKINELSENLYNEIISNTEPGAELPPLKKLEMFEYGGKLNKLIIEDD